MAFLSFQDQTKQIKKKSTFCQKYKKGVSLHTESELLEIAKATLVAEVLEQASYGDGTESVTVRLHFKSKK